MANPEPPTKRTSHAAPIRATDFQDREASDSYDDDDAKYSTDEEEEMSGEEAESDSGIIASDDDSDSGNLVQVNEHRAMDNRAAIDDNIDQTAFGRRFRVETEYQDTEEQRHVRIEETDPHIYRVPVKRGKQLMCLLKMHHRLIELKVRADNPDKYIGLGKVSSFDVRSIFTNPNDLSCIYVEVSDLRTCEAFLSQFMEYLGPYTATTFNKARTTRRKNKQPPPPLYFVPLMNRYNILDYQIKTEKINVGGFYELRHGKRAYRRDSCCVLEIKNQTAVVAVLPRILSLHSRERPSNENPPRRITREEFEDCMGESATYGSITSINRDNEVILLQDGYELLEGIPLRGLAPLSQERYLKAKGEIILSQISDIDKQFVNIANQKRVDNEKKSSLYMGEKVLIHNYSLRGMDLTNARGIVKSKSAGHGADAHYEVEITGITARSIDSDTGLQSTQGVTPPTRILHTIQRGHLIRLVSIGDHVQIKRGKYENTTGEVREVGRSADQRYLLLRIKVDTSNEYIGTLGYDADGDHEAISAFYDMTEEITSDEVRVHPGTWNGLSENKLVSGDVIKGKRLVQTRNNEDAVVVFIGHTNVVIVTASGEERICELEELNAVQRPFNLPMPKDHDGRMVNVESVVRVRDTVEEHKGVIGEIIQISINNPSILFVEPSKNIMERNIFPVDSRSCDSLVSGRHVDNYNRKLSRNRNTMNIGQQVVCIDRQYSGKQGMLISVNDRGEGQVQLSDRKITVPLHLLKVAPPLHSKQSTQVEYVPTASTVANVFRELNFSTNTAASSTRGTGFWFNDRSQTTRDMLTTQSPFEATGLNLGESGATAGTDNMHAPASSTNINNYGANDDDSDVGFEQYLADF